MEKGSTFTLEPIFTPNNASDQRVTYKSSNENVVTVSDTGLVTAKGVGNAKITVTSKDDKTKKEECDITVIVSASSVEISPSEKEIEIGKTVQLNGTITPGDVTTNALTWTSSNESIAHVDNSGLVTGMGEGIATITATTVNGKTSSSTITVKQVMAESVSLNKTSGTLEKGSTLQLTHTINPSDTTNKSVTWASSDTSVATVSASGLVTAVNAGSATITVKTSNGKTATCTVIVLDPYQGVPNQTYSVNQTIAYQGISFQVVKDNGSTVTLVTASDVGTGEFGSNTTFAGSTAYNYVNTTWVNANSGIKNEILGGGIITDATTNSKVRLLTTSEVSGKTNTSGNAYWTMTSGGSQVYYATNTGALYYKDVYGNNLTTATSPSSTTGRIDDTSTLNSACVRRCSQSGDCDYFECVMEQQHTLPLGYRPVITVKKK